MNLKTTAFQLIFRIATYTRWVTWHYTVSRISGVSFKVPCWALNPPTTYLEKKIKINQKAKELNWIDLWWFEQKRQTKWKAFGRECLTQRVSQKGEASWLKITGRQSLQSQKWKGWSRKTIPHFKVILWHFERPKRWSHEKS